MPRKKTFPKNPTIKSVRKKIKFQAPKGMYDILPEDRKYWDLIEKTAKEIISAYGFSLIDTPILEDARLYLRGTGASSDIVQKEMYTLRTKGNDLLALRPEFTPGIVRAYIEHGMKNLPQPVKLWSIGPIFRHEKPQSGRYRQFHQLNLEIIGEKKPINDAIIAQIFFLIFKKLGIEKILLHINSIGCPRCRPEYKKALLSYYRNKKRRERLCPTCRKRLKTNPLRLLDCKEEECRKIASNAPQTVDYLCEECHNHFKSVLEFLDELDIPYILDPHLVRGLDYYTKTVFEFKAEEPNNSPKKGKQESRIIDIAGGGRYDGLIELLGGRPTPAVGMAAGIERIISILKSKKIKIFKENAPQVFLVHLGELAKKKSLKLFEELRAKGLKITGALSKDSMRAQLKLADKLGVKISLILGQKEALENNIIIRDMKSGSQETVSIDRIIKEVKKRLK